MFTMLWQSMLRSYRRSRKPKAAKSIRRAAYLESELLEKRRTAQQFALAGAGPYPLTAAANFAQDPWLAPLGVILTPLNGISSSLSCNAYNSSGTFAYDLTGAFSITLHYNGSDANFTTTFDETGTVTYTIHTDGTVNNGIYSYDNYYFDEAAVMSWHYSQWNLHSQSNPITKGGTTTVSAFDSHPFDDDHWYVYNWRSLLSNLAAAESLSLGTNWSSFVNDESGGYSFTYNETTTAQLTISNPAMIGGHPVSVPPGGRHCCCRWACRAATPTRPAKPATPTRGWSRTATAMRATALSRYTKRGPAA